MEEECCRRIYTYEDIHGTHQKLCSLPKSLPSCRVSGSSWFKVSGKPRVRKACPKDSKPRATRGKDGSTSA